jgi:hypothetical protein
MATFDSTQADCLASGNFLARVYDPSGITLLGHAEIVEKRPPVEGDTITDLSADFSEGEGEEMATTMSHLLVPPTEVLIDVNGELLRNGPTDGCCFVEGDLAAA